MIKFSELLIEDKGGKNLHLEHLEDEIINYGVDGGRAAINFLQSLRDMLAGSSRSSVNMTVKWDGAPAIFAGVDPSDGKFFVAKKSVFNVSPKLYKTNKEIDDDLSGNLNLKSHLQSFLSWVSKGYYKVTSCLQMISRKQRLKVWYTILFSLTLLSTLYLLIVT